MKIYKIKRSLGYVVRFYDKDGNKIGYSTCSNSELKETLNKKEFFGKQVSKTDYSKI